MRSPYGVGTMTLPRSRLLVASASTVTRRLLDDIDARIERERKLREALRLMQTAHRQCFGSEAIGDECRLCLLKRILAETADDE